MDQEELNHRLLEAARRGDTQSVEDLVARGAHVNCKDGVFGWSPLHEAAWAGRTETVSRLVELGGDINSKTDDAGQSPLHVAVERGRTKTVTRLVELGGDVHVKDNKGQTPYDVARKDDIKELLKKALEHGVHQSDKDDPLTRIEDAATFKALLSDGEYESYGNRIYLAGACNVGKSTLASLLIGDEIPLTWKSTDGLRIFFGRNGIDLKELKMVPLKKGQGNRDVLTHVLRGQPDVKNVANARSNDGTAYQSGNANSNSSKPGQSSSRRFPSQEPEEQKFLKIHEDIKAEIRKGEYKIHIAPSDLVDFGGQKSYDMTHQLFIQGKGTFTLIFDGRKRLDEALKEEYPTGDITTASILKHWVDSILTYCGVDDGDVLPVILFVATHRDYIKDEEQSDKIWEFTEGLSKMFENHVRCKRINYSDIFFINATDVNDPEVERLKAKYVAIAMKQNSWGKPMPMRWVPLEMQMSAMREENKNLISKVELEEVNKANDDLALTEQQLEQFLRVQHSLGKILYFGGQGLGNYIIVQPTTLIDILRSFITDERFFPSDKNLEKILNDMTKTGKIKKTDLFRLWSQDEFKEIMPSVDFKEFVAKVLMYLDLLIEPKRGKDSRTSVDFFLVPCMVKHKPTDFFKDLEYDKTLFMSYKLSKSSIPSALTFKLIGAVLNVWPLKATEDRVCLYHKAAILDIDQYNELRIFGKDDRVVVCLMNKKIRGIISPDTASCVQECLTLAMTTALEFYHNSFGKIASNADISNLLQIDVGEQCESDICYISLTDARTKPSWKCSAGIEHKTKTLLVWTYDKKQESCATECTGLEAEVLNTKPIDKHLVRLASKISMKMFHEFIMHLGLSKEDWEDIEYTYGKGEWLSMKFDSLIELKRQGKNPTFEQLRNAVQKIDVSTHILCKIFREETEILETDNLKLMEIPDDTTLSELSRKIGNLAVHLGIELGIDINEIKASIIKYNKNMFDQNYDILMKWKYDCQTRDRAHTVNKTKIPCISRSKYPTVSKPKHMFVSKPKDPHVRKSKHFTVCKTRIPNASKNIRTLMHALWIVDRRGCDFLKVKYNIEY